MKVLVIGATGALGRVAVPALAEAGHRVVGTASSAQRAAAVREAGATPVDLDVFDPAGVATAIRATGAEAVVNIATRVPPLARAAFPRAWNGTHQLRRYASRAIAGACVATDVEVFVQEAVSFGYADGGDTPIAEDAPTDYRGAVSTVPDAILSAEKVAEAGRRGLCLLFGRFYGEDSMSRDTLAEVRRGRPVLFGDPDGWMAMLHLESAASALVAALGAPSGTYNVNDPAVTKRTVAGAYGAAASRPTKFYPAVARKVSSGAALLARSQRTSAAAFEEAAAWMSPHPDFAASYAELTRGW